MMVSYRRGALLAVVFGLLCLAIVIGLHFRSIAMRMQPLSALMQVLKARGYQENQGLAGRFAPGALVQIAEYDAAGARRVLPEPLVFMWGSDCFPKKTPEEYLYALPESSGKALDRLTVDGPSVDHEAPVFALQDNAVAHYRLRFGQPRVRTFAKGDMSLQFSQRCVAALNRAVSRGDEESFYAVVIETLVADFVEYEIDWTRSTDTKSHLELKSVIQARLRHATGRPTSAEVSVQTLSEGEDHSLLRASGELILAYRLRPIELTTTTRSAAADAP